MSTYSQEEKIFVNSLASALFVFKGNLGVGATSPIGRLYIKGIGSSRDDGFGSAIEIQASAPDEYPSIIFNGQASNNYSAILWTTDTSGNNPNMQAALIYTIPYNGGTDADLYFFTSSAIGSSPPGLPLIMKHNGNVIVAGNGDASPWFVADPANTVSLNVIGTDAMLLPKGTTAQRPTGVDGFIRFNTDTSRVEAFYGGIWNNL